MSAELEFMIFMENVKDFFNKRSSEEEKIVRNMRRNIEATKKSIEELKNIKTALEIEKMRTEEEIKEYIKYFREIKEYEKAEKCENFLSKLKGCELIGQVLDIYSEANNVYEEHKYEQETEGLSDEKLIEKYIVLKLEEMGQKVYFNEDGKIVSVSNGSDIIIEIDKDNIKMDVPGKARKCISTLIDFEKLTKNELEKKDVRWHTAEREKQIKEFLEKVKNPTEKEKTVKKIEHEKEIGYEQEDSYYDKSLVRSK